MYRATGAATTYSQVATLPSYARTFTQTGLRAGTGYRYTVRPFDAMNNLGVLPVPAAVTTPTTGMGVPLVSSTVGAAGTTTTPVTFVIGVQSDTAAAVTVAAAKVSFVISNGAGTTLATKALTTNVNGVITLRIALPRGTTYSVTLTGVTAIGRTWDGVTPANAVAVS